MELRVAADGAPWLRPAASAAEPAPAAQRARPLHVSARLITLGSSLGTLVLWRDSLPPERFRQLAAYARWHIERAQPGVGPAAGG